MRKETVRRGTDQDPQNVTGLSNGLKFQTTAHTSTTLNSALCIEDNVTASMTVLVDQSLGGASLADGSIELMVHRRIMADDALAIRPTKGKLYGLDRRGG